MPTDEEIRAEKAAKMESKTASDATSGSLVLPRFPLVPIPEKLARAFPELARWNLENHVAIEQWRERVTVVLSRITEKTDESLSEAIEQEIQP